MNMQQIMTRRQAAEAGLKRYYNGRPCSKGHESPRFTSTGACVTCAASYVKEYNSRLKKESLCRAQGIFSYRLHPDDVAAALAYCQALDLQRGVSPQEGKPARQGMREMTIEEAEAARRRIFADKFAPEEKPAHVPTEMRPYGDSK